jgi:3-methyl-2-oxobutanoate hydroxymethyltransferase
MALPFKSMLMHSTVQTAIQTVLGESCCSFQRRFIGKVSSLSLTSKKRKGQKITMVTAYDYPSAIHVARATIDIILVGDSVAMVELGYDTTQPVTMENMLHHASAVKRGVVAAGVSKYPLLIGDMPFGSYEFDNTDIAMNNAYRFVKDAGMDAIKLEVSKSRMKGNIC